MEEEFNLSDEIKGNPKALDEPVVKTKKIKQFIKLLKEGLKEQSKENCGSLYLDDINRLIKELAGDKLI